jgi:hypothetical protein
MSLISQRMHAYLPGRLYDYAMPDEETERLVCDLKRC